MQYNCWTRHYDTPYYYADTWRHIARLHINCTTPQIATHQRHETERHCTKTTRYETVCCFAITVPHKTRLDQDDTLPDDTVCCFAVTLLNATTAYLAGHSRYMTEHDSTLPHNHWTLADDTWPSRCTNWPNDANTLPHITPLCQRRTMPCIAWLSNDNK